MGVQREVLIYANGPMTKFRWVSYVSAIQVGFIFINLFVTPTDKTRRQGASRKQGIVSEFDLDGNGGDVRMVKPHSTWEKLKMLNYSEIFCLSNLVENIKEKPYLSATMIVTSCAISTGFIMYARRSAHLITLLPNERVRFSSFSPLGLGRPPSIEVPLSHVSCVQPRSTKDNFSILKIKGYMGYHLVSKTDGDFIEPQMFDEYLGYSRSWS